MENSSETVYIREDTSGHSTFEQVSKAQLVRRTPSGQVVARREGTQWDIRFDKGGYEMGCHSTYSRARLMTEEQYNDAVRNNAKIHQQLDVRDQVKALGELFNNYSGHCDKERLVAELKMALAAAEAL
jgi:hypothetical protein